MNKDELRDLLIEAKVIMDKLRDAWHCLEDIEIVKATDIVQLPCDACEVIEEDIDDL